MSISVALFDLDDTLFAHREAVDRGIETFIGSTGAVFDPAEIARWRELEEHHYHRYLAGELDYVGQRRARARGFAAAYGVPLERDRDAEAWFEDYVGHYRAAWKLHADALPCLDGLAIRGIRLGIITNGDVDFQQVKLDRLGLSERFEHVVASGAVGVAKPDRRIFELACSTFGVPVEDALYVGDRLLTDAVGAAEAGLTGVWLDRRGAAREETETAEAAGVIVISTLADLPGLV
ncbi:MAG: HAD family hydrolase [Rhodoglobus sp.]|nr:HAD family hydrolase [Rhodoglobus sp.]